MNFIYIGEEELMDYFFVFFLYNGGYGRMNGDEGKLFLFLL